MSSDTHSRHCSWLIFWLSLAHIADAVSLNTGHSRTIASVPPPEASIVPSGLNATPFTVPTRPVSASPTGFPVVAPHSRTVPSVPPAEARRLPSGLNATPHTPLV